MPQEKTSPELSVVGKLTDDLSRCRFKVLVLHVWVVALGALLASSVIVSLLTFHSLG